jgi:hypothetical protein
MELSKNNTRALKLALYERTGRWYCGNYIRKVLKGSLRSDKLLSILNEIQPGGGTDVVLSSQDCDGIPQTVRES